MNEGKNMFFGGMGRVLLAGMMTLILMVVILPVLAQDNEAEPSTEPDSLVALVDTLGDAEEDAEALEEIAASLEDTTAMVTVLGQDLFEVGALSVMSASERADKLGAAILKVAKSVRSKPEELRALRDDRINGTLLVCGTTYLGTVWSYEAEALGIAEQDLADERLEIIRQSIVDYRSDFSRGSLFKSIAKGAVALVLFIVLLTIISRVRGRLENTLEERVGGKTMFKILKGESLVDFTKAINRLAFLSLVLWLGLAVLNYLLSLFPWTYGIAAQVYDLASGPLKAFGATIVEQVPSFFFLAFIAVLTVFTLRTIRFFFNEIDRGRITLRGFYPDWARPTFNIVRLVVLAFSFTVAFPYIPGSSSSAFKGMSLFVGLLVSLGSGSAMANVISGIILIYMRPFAIGDRIQIGTTIGDVIDRNLLTTRLRTTKNERVTIPNTNILAGQIINFTSKARTKELILHSSVTIGYDVPWRQVHELLVSAAREVENFMDDPEPYVLQKGLDDFYIEYEINAHTDKPRSIPSTYSELHQNIQDKFNEAGVKILSPHYRVLRQDEP
jgi:small-conductance mechanosensitive channel